MTSPTSDKDQWSSRSWEETKQTETPNDWKSSLSSVWKITNPSYWIQNPGQETKTETKKETKLEEDK